MTKIIAYVSIGNSDDKLTQAEWARYFSTVAMAVHRAAHGDDAAVHGQWASEPASQWQNACWCVELNVDSAELLKLKLCGIAGDFRQDSIAWAVVRSTEFLCEVSGE